jgi:hypothetical protein
LQLFPFFAITTCVMFFLIDDLSRRRIYNVVLLSDPVFVPGKLVLGCFAVSLFSYLVSA